MSDETLKRIEIKVDKLDARLDSMTVIQTRQEMNLKEHMKRSDLLEKKLEPVETHVMKVTWAVKGILWAAGVIGGVAVTLKQLGII